MSKITSVRAKFVLTSVVTTEWSPTSSTKEYNFSAQYDSTIPEDVRFQKASPSGAFKITIDNPIAQDFFAGKTGKAFYLDMVDVLVVDSK